MTTIRTIQIEELQRRLSQLDQLEFWNVLTDEYFHGEMIPGSRRVPLDQVGRESADVRISKETEIIVYCAGPSCPQSHRAAEKLVTLGFHNVAVYEGGIAAWKKAGRPMEYKKAA